jgi:hypothetical protein
MKEKHRFRVVQEPSGGFAAAGRPEVIEIVCVPGEEPAGAIDLGPAEEEKKSK